MSVDAQRPLVLLSGGTGGAKLARGMLDVVGPEALVVVANTGDDIEIYGASVSPDPDLVCSWLADRIDARGFGIAGDSFAVMDALHAVGGDPWFSLGDRDLAWCVRRRQLLDAGHTPTQALAQLAGAIGVRARVLPASDAPLHTWVRTDAGWRSFEQFIVRERGEGEIVDVQFRGADTARPSADVLAALAGAGAIVIGPSNPIASIGPMLALGGMREAIAGAAAPVVAVSPIVGGAVLKGPTAAFMRQAGLTVDAAGVAACYDGLLDGMVSDTLEDADADADARGESGLHWLCADTRMDGPQERAQVARLTLRFVLSLTR